MSTFWSFWIVGLTLTNLVLILWVLLANRKVAVKDDADPENRTTGHVYDGIEEYDNPLPKWWFQMFILTIVFTALYLLLYPGLGSWKGYFPFYEEGHWTSTRQLEEQQKKALGLIPNGSAVLGVGPTANWAGKTWPYERFIEVIEWMTAQGGLMPDARVAVFAAPGEEEAAYKVLESIPEDRRLDLIAKTDPGTAAAALARCDYYIGNDSGLMHCAAAAGVSTFGVFGPSYPHIYRPWGAHASYASTPQNFDELIDFEGYDVNIVGSLMTSLTVDMVKEGMKKAG